MKNQPDIDEVAEMQLALTEVYPDSGYGAVPVADHYDALLSYRSTDEDALAEIPGAFAAHLDYQRNQWG